MNTTVHQKKCGEVVASPLVLEEFYGDTKAVS
jgi:hypothetical protein